MNRFVIPNWVKDFNFEYQDYRDLHKENIEKIRLGLAKLNHPTPLVSIIIPAWNEEKNIIRTLSSFSRMKLAYPTELIVVNNNSTDRTQEILDFLGVKSFFQPIQGISVTRQMGLENAKGSIILSADADSIYPQDWGKKYVELLLKPENAIAYGRYSFIPSKGSRFSLAIHEILAEMIFGLRDKKKPFVNVMGFNFAYRRADALAIGGFSRTKMLWEDGAISKRISEKFGKVVPVTSPDARVWTSDRRLLADGSLWKAFIRRVTKELKYVHELLPLSK
jgi:glycosyltransferase involved in cell wall biosynthesis